MITDVSFNGTTISAGQNILMTVEAKYPIVVDIHCFVTHPPPPRYEPCPDSGKRTLQSRQAVQVRTDPKIFQENGFVDFNITDADFDHQFHRITVLGVKSKEY